LLKFYKKLSKKPLKIKNILYIWNMVNKICTAAQQHSSTAAQQHSSTAAQQL
jgi:hypothetical protein